MKNSIRKTKQPPMQNGPTSPRRFPKWAVAGLLVLLGGGATFALFEFVILARLPPELVGKWRAVGGPFDGLTLEFKRNGTMIGEIIKEGKENRLEGKAEVVGKTLRTTTVNPLTEQAESGTQTIVRLTETELVTEDKNGVRITMKRVP